MIKNFILSDSIQKRILEYVRKQKQDDIESEYQMYWEDVWDKAIEDVSKATTSQDVIQILCAKDFFIKENVEELLNVLHQEEKLGI